MSSASPSSPFIKVPGVANFRSVTVPGLRPQFLFRSAEPSQISSAGIKVLHDLGIATIFDLRSMDEVSPDAVLVKATEWKGITRVSIPIFTKENCPPEIHAQVFNFSTNEFMLSIGRRGRTGVLIAVILSLCGVSDEEIAREYSLTNIGLSEMSPEWDGDFKMMEKSLISTQENFKATLEALKNTYGGAERYVKDCCGLADEEVMRIREHLLIDKTD
ncbi:unnamed protein product [Clonostachys chloroleuca]|uniref:Uncharacterized protein n=1 Tax=Clonostachys chloroleuca TaxID=1926264 RepID=A0AA35M5I2_9HYPO|nr:unnamed protein product [Clonostachys chloroleuca]